MTATGSSADLRSKSCASTCARCSSAAARTGTSAVRNSERHGRRGPRRASTRTAGPRRKCWPNRTEQQVQFGFILGNNLAVRLPCESSTTAGGSARMFKAIDHHRPSLAGAASTARAGARLVNPDSASAHAWRTHRVHDKRLRYPVMNAIMSLMILGAAAGPGLAMAAGETPAFKATRWVNSAPIGAEALRGKVVLVNFWEYTCINWIRTSPYIKAWNRDYAKLGLVVIGVHTPEFEFGKRAENIDRGIRDFGLTYPIAVDNDSAIWYAFGNDAWPATYLFDAQGKLVDRWEGEGSYDEIESEIRRLLLAANPGVKLPETSPEVTAYAKTGDPNYAGITNETYVGTDRRERGAFTLTGSWQSKPQYVKLKTGTGKITVPFTGGEV